jgi:hypothetical protein
MRKEAGTKGKQGNGVGNPAIGKGEACHILPPCLRVAEWADTPRRFECTAPFHSKTKTSLCAIVITFRTSYRAVWSLQSSCIVGRKTIERLLWKLFFLNSDSATVTQRSFSTTFWHAEDHTVNFSLCSGFWCNMCGFSADQYLNCVTKFNPFDA